MLVRSASLVASILGVATLAFASSAHGPAPVSPEDALARLRAGNERFVHGKSTHDHAGASRRKQLASSQAPFAVVLSCADSRVPPEILFDQGLGDLFVVRTAGQVADPAVLGSVEYAVEHLGAQLVLVMGHERCGAVAAAVAGGEAHGHIGALVEAIQPAVAASHDVPGDAAENAMRENVRRVVTQLKDDAPVLSDRVHAGTLQVVGARYDLDTGTVELIESHPR